MKLAIALLTKDHPELTQRSIEPLLQPDRFDLFVIDGSDNTDCQGNILNTNLHFGIRGGPDAAIVYALTEMLQDQYTHIGLCEQDVLLDPDWFEPTIRLFDTPDLKVGAVSARCYEDRILIQRDGYAVCHNLGAGMVIWTREAAELILKFYRTGWAPDNRRIFGILSGIDIGSYWAFRGGEHWLTADWHFDVILAAHGLASLALTPSKATMLDQDIVAQGLKMAGADCEDRRVSTIGWELFRERMTVAGKYRQLMPTPLSRHKGQTLVFPHQIGLLGGSYAGDWSLRWRQGFGPFEWVAVSGAEIRIPVFGTCEVLLSGSGTSHVGGITVSLLGPERGIVQVSLPGSGTREIVITLAAGDAFHGVLCHQPQLLRDFAFDWAYLPKVEP